MTNDNLQRLNQDSLDALAQYDNAATGHNWGLVCTARMNLATALLGAYRLGQLTFGAPALPDIKHAPKKKEAENVMRSALHFYAERENWIPPSDIRAGAIHLSRCAHDSGQLALSALVVASGSDLTEVNRATGGNLGERIFSQAFEVSAVKTVSEAYDEAILKGRADVENLSLQESRLQAMRLKPSDALNIAKRHLDTEHDGDSDDG